MEEYSTFNEMANSMNDEHEKWFHNYWRWGLQIAIAIAAIIFVFESDQQQLSKGFTVAGLCIVIANRSTTISIERKRTHWDKIAEKGGRFDLSDPLGKKWKLLFCQFAYIVSLVEHIGDAYVAWFCIIQNNSEMEKTILRITVENDYSWGCCPVTYESNSPINPVQPPARQQLPVRFHLSDEILLAPIETKS